MLFVTLTPLCLIVFLEQDQIFSFLRRLAPYKAIGDMNTLITPALVE